MPNEQEDLSIEIIERIADIDRSAWMACAGVDNPFVGYDFLSCLEDSGSVSAQTGWAPRHVVIRHKSGLVMACMPLYLKSHSQGEYIFDWGWAEAYERAGGQYYPKLISAIPFTPVTTPKLLLHPSAPKALQAQLIQSISSLATQAHLSSVHLNFLNEPEKDTLLKAGFLHRLGLQYHWRNNNYGCYDDFLAALTSRKRKALKKERREALDGGTITIQKLQGADIQPCHWDAMYGFYCDTGARKRGQPYLNREFFQLIGERMADQILLVMALRGDHIIAGALNFIGKEALYGRYWGSSEDVRFLHFELCYHQAIEAAIELGLQRVEAGAQGEHKIARGYLPTLTHSAHFITDENFRQAVSSFLQHERQAIVQEHKILMTESPYRQTPDIA
ncbi:MAG: N-acetyltransferase [Magnetovibrio sp.]|nr:N-acetyltransferase [Magnetovibrio sp.]